MNRTLFTLLLVTSFTPHAARALVGDIVRGAGEAVRDVVGCAAEAVGDVTDTATGAGDRTYYRDYERTHVSRPYYETEMVTTQPVDVVEPVQDVYEEDVTTGPVYEEGFEDTVSNRPINLEVDL